MNDIIIDCPFYSEDLCKCIYDPDQDSEWNKSDRVEVDTCMMVY